MKKIRIAVADGDPFYLKQLVSLLVKSTQGFEVYSFGKQESLEHFLSGGDPVDILLVSEDMRSGTTDGCSAVKVLLSEGAAAEPPEGYGSVQKYQKTASLIAEVLLIYGRKSGRGEDFARGDRETRVIGVWSPVGGSGKTTIALLLSQQLGMARKKVFYQNWERVNSTRGILPDEAQIGLSEILVDICGGERSVGLRIVSKMAPPTRLGFSYVAPAESALELDELSLEEQKSFLRTLGELDQFDAVILDFESELSGEKRELLGMCQRLVVPFLPDAVSMNKLMGLFHEASLHMDLAQLLERALFVGNRVSQEAQPYLERLGLFQKCAPVAMLPWSRQIADVRTALLSGEGGGELRLVADMLMK